MPTNNGIFKEDEMVHHLDNKKVKELSNNLRNLVTALFGVLDEEEVVHCQKTDDFIKPDFCIEYRGKKKYVSMKSGRAETVHQELIKNFVLFLREKAFPKERSRPYCYTNMGTERWTAPRKSASNTTAYGLCLRTESKKPTKR